MMKLETRSVAVREEGGVYSKNRIIREIQEWTPYRITPLPDHKVHVASTGTYFVEDFTRKRIPLSLPYNGGVVVLIQSESDYNLYDVGGLGVLQIYDDACTFTSISGKTKYTARIPSRDKTDAICTGMAYFGIADRTVGGEH